MQRVRVISSNLRSVGYDVDAQMLEVQFRDRSVYQYFGIPADLCSALLEAPSKGRFLHRYIAHRFAYRRVA